MKKSYVLILFIVLLLSSFSVFGNKKASNIEKILSENGYNVSSINSKDKIEILDKLSKKTQKYDLSKNGDKGVLIKSIKKDKLNSYKIIIRSELTEKEIYETFTFFDNNISIKKENEGIYVLNIPYNSNLSKSFFTGIDNGFLSTNILNFDVIEPELIKLDSSTSYLSGETLSNLWGITKMGADKFQEGLSNKPKIKVGIIDTGIDYTHNDLSGNIYTNTGEIAGNNIDDDNNGYIDDIKGYDFINNDNDPFDDNSHGTHVSGIAGGLVNGGGIFGVNSNVNLVGLKVLSAAGAGSSYDIGEAIRYAADNGIKVINMSLGGKGSPKNSYLCNSINYALGKGTISVVAAGNSNANVSAYVPAGCPNAITVGAVDSTLTRAYFSNYGDLVDVAAAGVNIYSSVPGNNYDTWNGTSMATPFITGLISAMITYNNTITLNDIVSTFKNTSLTDNVITSSSKKIGRFANMYKILSSMGVTPQ